MCYDSGLHSVLISVVVLLLPYSFSPVLSLLIFVFVSWLPFYSATMIKQSDQEFCRLPLHQQARTLLLDWTKFLVMPIIAH